MSGNKEDWMEGLVAPGAPGGPAGDDPSPCTEEARPSMFASGLVQLLLAIAAVAVVGTAVTIFSMPARELGGVRTERLVVGPQRQAQIEQARAEESARSDPQRQAPGGPPAENVE
jgi:hypothetical protein